MLKRGYCILGHALSNNLFSLVKVVILPKVVKVVKVVEVVEVVKVDKVVKVIFPHNNYFGQITIFLGKSYHFAKSG